VKNRWLLSFAVGGLILAGLMLLRTTAVHAQCGPNFDQPCDGGDQEREKKPTRTSPPATPTLIPTNTPPACTERAWYRDADADGYGVPGTTLYACTAPGGYGALLADCNDASPAINPGAADVCGDGMDHHCDGADAVCAVAAPAPITEACVGPDCAPDSLAGGGAPWMLGLGGILVGILIGLLVPAVSRSFFDRSPRAGSFFDTSVGKGTPGGGDTDPAGSFFDSQPGGGADPAGSFFDSNPALKAREAALNAREAALNAREAALKAGGSPKSGFDTDM